MTGPRRELFDMKKISVAWLQSVKKADDKYFIDVLNAEVQAALKEFSEEIRSYPNLGHPQVKEARKFCKQLNANIDAALKRRGIDGK